MSFTETTVWEGTDESPVLITYRVRVCTRCGHEACPCCRGLWCDACFLGIDEETDRESNPKCADDQKCVYDEPDSEAVLELRRETKTRKEFIAALWGDD